MSGQTSRYREQGAPDYGHGFHAGNVGDVWKHCGLLEALRLASPGAATLTFVESHAGEGGYRLGSTGEWSAGIARVAVAADPASPAARHVDLCRRLGFAGPSTWYPGSPALARAVLGEHDQMILWERDPAAHAQLARRFAEAPGVLVHAGDGVAALAQETRSAESRPGAVVALVDPPWTAKEDWIRIPDALAQAVGATERTCFLLWYPVKSLTRPNAMLARLARAGVRAAIAELVTTPLDQRRNRLNGSGLLAIRPPSGWMAAMGSAAPTIGAACATHGGAWSLRLSDAGGSSEGSSRSPEGVEDGVLSGNAESRGAP